MIRSFAFRRLALAGLAPLGLLGACAAATPPPAVAAAPVAATSDTRPGIVSAADPRAAEAGAEMLRAGGSATDAAIATMLALGVVEPQSSGIGGGGFLVRGAADGSVETLDGRETAPKAAIPGWFLDEAGQPRPFPQAVMSGLSVGVPGNLRLAAKAHAEHGRLDWAQLFAPAIRLARAGFAITPRLHNALTVSRDTGGFDAAGRALFYDKAGDPLPVGTVIRNPELAATLERIAREGPQAFYSGDNAAAIARRVASETPHPAGMTQQDIAAYAAKDRPPVCGTYRTYRICGMGPPSSGATTVFAILKQLEGFDLAALGKDSPVAWHLIAESQRLAYADRELYLGDPDFLAVPVKGLIDPTYLAARGRLISPDRTMASAAAGTPPGTDALALADGDEPAENGTSHFVAIDRWGDAVSYTSTVESAFGSGIMVGGYYLNNELTDFSFTPEKGGRPVANRVEGGKRPRSSMAPTVVYDAKGRLVLAVGAAGGATIPVQVAKVLIAWIDWGLSAQQAIALPVIYSPGDTIFVEQGTALEGMIPALHALGHASIVAREMPLKANAVERGERGWIGAADPRSEGASVSE